MKRVINVPLSHSGIDAAIIELKAYKMDFERKCKAVRHEVAERVKQKAEDMYLYATYNDWVDGHTDRALVPIVVEETENQSIVIAGYPAIFIEFGAGVTHNGPVFTSPHPMGYILNFTIGSYRQGRGWAEYGPYKAFGNASKGQFESWYVPDKGFTRGTPSQRVLWNAMQLTLAEMDDIINEVFNDD